MITEQEARQMFDDLRNDDEHFNNQWGYKNAEVQDKAFYEWCSLYDDLKHIKQKNQIEWYCSTNGVSTWYCNSCNEYIDDNVQEVEMHECKTMEVA